MTPFPHLWTLYRLLIRGQRAVRAAARQGAVTLTACMGTALWCCYGTLYTAFGLVFSGAALVVTAVLAAACWIVSGE